MDLWGWLWVVWGLAFAAIEGTALARDNAAGTLSEHLRLWLRTDTKLGRTIWAIVSGVFFGWFVIHIAAPGLVWA